MDDFEHLDHYAILGVSRSATAEEIKRAYRQQMARYHPDRFAGAPAEEQAYATRRALRINAAYAALSDFNERLAYNRSLGSGAGEAARAAARAAATPHPPRDHLAELYDQAHAHLVAGRKLQAAATLREILQLNPFYRDSAALLAQAEARPQPRPAAPAPPAAPAVADRGRRALVAGGLGALALAGLGAVGWAIRGRAAGAMSQPAAGATAPAGGAASPVPATAAVASAPTGLPSAAPPLAASPAPPPTAVPTVPPTAVPTVPPTAQPAAPTAAALAEEGPLLYAEPFSGGSGWPSLSGQGWSVGQAEAGYQIVAAAGAGNIWAYSTAPAESYLAGVDVVVSGGVAGLLLRFSQAAYLAFLVNPALGSYRLLRRDGARDTVLIEEGHPAIALGADAANRLVARLEGEAVALRINGRAVYDAVVRSPAPSARYGLVAIAEDAPEVIATFSNLALRGL